MRIIRTLILGLVLLSPVSAGAQVADLQLPDLTVSADVRQRATMQAHASLVRAITNARAGTVYLTRGPNGEGYMPVDRSAFEASIAVQVAAGQLTDAQGQSMRQQMQSGQPSLIAEADAYASRLGAALSGASSRQVPGPTGPAGPVPCDVLRQAPTDNVVDAPNQACTLRLGNPARPDQLFILGAGEKGSACDDLRIQFRSTANTGAVREIAGLGEFAFEGPSQGQYGVAFCRNGYAFVGLADANAPQSVRAAMLDRARIVDARLQRMGTPASRPAQAPVCNPPAVGPLADGVPAALTLRSGTCVPGVLLDMGGADYSIRTAEGERRVPLDQVAIIDFTSGGSTDSNPPEGQHLLIRRNGQRATGRLYDLRERSPLAVDFDSAAGRTTSFSTDIDRIVLAPVPTTAGPTPGSGGVPAPSMPQIQPCSVLTGDWRADNGMIIRYVPRGANQEAYIVDGGALAASFRPGELTFRGDGSPQPGVCTGQALFRFGDGRSVWQPTRITMRGPDAYDTDNAGRWVRVGAGGAPGGTPMLPGPAGGTVMGSWRGCDGRVVTFSQSGDEIIGRYTSLGNWSPTAFALGDVGYRLRPTPSGSYEGFVEHRWLDGRRQWMPTTVTISGDNYRDSGSDLCSQSLTRVGASPGVPPAGNPMASGVPGGVPEARMPPGQPQAAFVGNFTGEWDTVNGGIRTVMRLQQQGNRVTGTYDYQQGILLGTVNGNTLTLTWTHGAPTAFMGTAQFVLSADGRSFSGPWSAPTQQGTWSGTRR